MDIFFHDLSPDAQTALLRFYNILSPADLNWDVVPLFCLEQTDDAPCDA